MAGLPGDRQRFARIRGIRPLVEQNATFALRHAERLALLKNGAVELTGMAESFTENEYVRDAYVGVT